MPVDAVESCLSPIQIESLTPHRDEENDRNRELYAKSKRLIDILIALVLGPAVILVIAIAALAIAIAMGRPIFFFSDRIGRNGRPFRMIKLRTMTGHSGRPTTATARGDPRVTPLGRILRHSHIDELPQLWNILVGDMTLIGPRPEQPQLVAYYRENIPDYDLRHVVTPGLSGWAQVCFGYATDITETRQKLVYDLEYVDRYGPKIDLIVAWKTVRIYMDPNYVR